MDEKRNLQMKIELYSDGTSVVTGIKEDGREVVLEEANTRCEDLEGAEIRAVLFKKNPWCWMENGRLRCWPL